MAEAKIRITADTKQAEQSLSSLDRALGNLDKQSRMATAALGAITAAGAALGFAVAKTLQSVDELAKTSKSLGMTAADLQAFRNSAQLAGVSSDELTGALRRLQNNIGEALIKGTGPAKQALDRLGVSMSELKGLSADQQFQRIAEEIAKIPDPALRAATATDLLGKQGPKLLEAANEMSRLRKEAEHLGIALTSMDTKAIQMANDSFSELSFIASGFLQKLTAAIAPAIIVITRRIKETIMAWGGVDKAIEKIIKTIKILVQVAAALLGIIAAGKILVVAAGFLKLGAAVLVVARNLRTLGVAAAAAKAIATGGLSAIVTATAGVAGALVAATAAGRVMDSLFEDMAEVSLEIEQSTSEIAPNLNTAADAADLVADNARKALEAFDKTLKNLETQTRYELDVLSIGKEQAEIQQLITQEREKLLEAGVAMTAEQQRQLTMLKQEEQLVKQISQFRTESQNALKGMMDPQAVARIESNRKLTQAQEAYNRALESGNQTLISESRQALKIFSIQYEDEITKFARSRVEKLKIEDQFKKDIRSLDEAQQGLLILGFTRESELFRDLQDEKLRLLEEVNRKMEQIELKRINNVLMAERQGMAKSLSDTDKALLQRVGAEERQKAIVDERIKFEKKSDLEKTSFAIDNLQSVFAALGTQNRKAFEAQKALAVASALMNTYQGATKALATYPFPFGLIAAAAAVAAGMAQVGAIRSQQYSGRRLGGPVVAGGQSYIVGESGPELFTPNNAGSITRNSDLGGGGAVSVNFTIVANDTQGFDQLLSSRKGVITQIISDAMLERGVRSMV